MVLTGQTSTSSSIAGELVDRLVAVVAAGDQLGDHRVVEGRDRVAFLDAGLDAAVVAQVEMLEPADARQEALRRILGVEPRLDRVAVDRQLVLRLRQLLAARDAQLPFDQVLAGDLLGHRMLDLQPRVHFHEPDAVGA